MYNSFLLSDYEHFLLEVFNININTKEDVLYLISSNYQVNISNLYYYGSFIDNDFNEIELYVICLRNIDAYKDVEDVIYNLLSLNQTNHAFITVFSNYSHKWFFSYLFSEYAVVDNRLETVKSKIDDYIHWYGHASSDNIITKMSEIKISSHNIRELLKLDQTSILIKSLGDLVYRLDKSLSNSNTSLDAYDVVLDVMMNIINNTKPKSSLKLDVLREIKKIEKSSNMKVAKQSIIELYNYTNNQEELLSKHARNVCEDTLIEYLCKNTILSRDDIISYVKYAYDNRKLIRKHVDEAIKNGGRYYVNMKVPLTIIYNIDDIQEVLDKIKVLDFSINSGIMITAMIYLISKLKYVNKIIQGYATISMDDIIDKTINDNIYMITLNKKSIKTLKILLNNDKYLDNKINYTDALTLYDHYEYIRKSLDDMNLNKSKNDVIEDIVNSYNKTHMHTKMTVDFIKRFKKKHGYNPLVYQLDYREVFKNNHKFDIIISNVEHVKLTGLKEIKKQLRKYELYDNNQRYEYYFIEKATDIIDSRGIISLVINNEYQTSDESMVRDYLKEYEILQETDNKLIYTSNKPKK